MKTAVKQIKEYETTDGKRFSDYKEAENHGYNLMMNDDSIIWRCEIISGESFGDFLRIECPCARYLKVFPEELKGFGGTFLIHQLYVANIYVLFLENNTLENLWAIAFNDKKQPLKIIHLAERRGNKMNSAMENMQQ